MGLASTVSDALGGDSGPPPAFKGLASVVEKAINRSGERASVIGPETKPEEEKKSLFDRYAPAAVKWAVGGPDAALTAVRGAVAAPIGAVAGIAKNLTSGTLGTKEGLLMAQARAKEVSDIISGPGPYTEVGKKILGKVGEVMETSKLQGLGPTEALALQGAALPKANKTGPRGMGSVGASGTDPNEIARASVSNSTPELRAIVEQHIQKGKDINQPALDRVAEADSLPIPIRLSKGQATQDVALLSDEQNLRGKHEALASRFNEQNKQLIENTNRIRENAAPDVYATSKPEHGEILIDAYKAKDAKLNADISAKYQALRDANGGQFPLDSKAFVESADAALHKALLYDQVPSGLRTTLDRLKEEGMTFENFESMRTNLARIQRSQTADGNVKHAAGIIRNALEEMPMSGAESLKPLADEARAAAKARFSLIESDPAYKAVVTGKASADKFIDKHVIGADLKDVKAMRENLTDSTAQQAIASGVVNHLKQRAGVIGDEGNFSQSGYNKALESIRPKLDVIFNPEQKKQIETLGNVARYTQAQPRGSYVNNSGTAVTLMKEGAKSAVEGAANVAAGGVPVGSWGRRFLSHRSQSKLIHQTLEPGAGILLKDVK